VSFRAKYRGECIDCDDPIEVGNLVEFDDDRNLRHVLCEDDRDFRTGRPLPVCPRCFCTIPVSGVCGVCEPED
jgi:hypothetical protein